MEKNKKNEKENYRFFRDFSRGSYVTCLSFLIVSLIFNSFDKTGIIIKLVLLIVFGFVISLWMDRLLKKQENGKNR